VLSDTYGLQFAMSVVPLFGLAAAVLYVVAARTYPADLKHIERAVPAVDGALTPQAA